MHMWQCHRRCSCRAVVVICIASVFVFFFVVRPSRFVPSRITSRTKRNKTRRRRVDRQAKTNAKIEAQVKQTTESVCARTWIVHLMRIHLICKVNLCHQSFPIPFCLFVVFDIERQTRENAIEAGKKYGKKYRQKPKEMTRMKWNRWQNVKHLNWRPHRLQRAHFLALPFCVWKMR